ncbi:hypothetical protein QBC41DRAFT_320918 [Cercophora samala]|uniref:Uncharacterized protein n=1 Tax=Cercophora samala TaxID=330535 RepID=A0AA40DA29_9PEZI|nr:hypothetical protein QBC41DRAFT_320918 [Cercophora samala]
MPTPLDHAMRSRNAFLAFTGLVTGVAVWAIWGGDMFPTTPDPTGNPEEWSKEDLRRWLAAVCCVVGSTVLSSSMLTSQQRNLHPQDSDTREQLLERVKANMRIPRQ